MNLDASTAKLFEHFSTQEFEGVSEMSAAEARVEQNGNLGDGINGLLSMIQGLERRVSVAHFEIRRPVAFASLLS